MSRIRVLLASMPSMLTEIIDDLVSAESDMQVVGHAPCDGDVLGLARRTDAQVVIVRKGGADPEHDLLGDLVAADRLRILAIADDGKTGCLYRLHPKAETLGELSGASLVDAVRSAARQDH